VVPEASRIENAAYDSWSALVVVYVVEPVAVSPPWKRPVTDRLMLLDVDLT
jgi:hypothetical protein